MISIIIPTKNEEDNIGLCLESINKSINNININNYNYEIIIVDNGSTDSTLSVIKRYGVKAHIMPNLNLSELRNYGAKVAKGDIYAFLDADCIVDENWLKQASIAFNNPDVGCTGSTPVAPEFGTWVEKIWSSFRARRKKICFTSWINSSNFFVRRELFDKVNGFNPEVKTCEDVDIGMRLINECKILFDPSIKVIHLGEPKTIFQFFCKEIWRGKGSISGLFSHGICISELKSIILPLYYLITTICIVASIVLFKYKLLLILICIYVMPAILFTLWITAVTQKINYIFGYIILFLVYVNARFISLFYR